MRPIPIRWLMALCLLFLTVHGGTTKEVPGPMPAGPNNHRQRLHGVLTKLAQPIILEKGFEPNTTLKSATDFLSDRYDLTILIDTKSFEDDAKLKETPLLKIGLIQRMINVELRSVLRSITEQLPAPGGSFVIARDHIVIVPKLYERTPITWDFDNLSLGDALRELASLTDETLIIDEGLIEQFKTPVTAQLRKVPLETAVRCIANMGALKVVTVGHALYVTTPEKAKAMQDDDDHRMKKAVSEEGVPVRVQDKPKK